MKRLFALIAAFCLLPLFAFAGDQGDRQAQPRYALIASSKLTNRLNLRESPSADSQTLGRFYNGTVVEVMEKGDEWSYVRVGKRLWGYMMNEYLVYFDNPDGFMLGGEMGGREQGMFRAVMERGAGYYDAMKNSQLLDCAGEQETVIVLGDVNDDWLLVQRSGDVISAYVRRQDIAERSMYGLAVVTTSKPESMVTLRADARDNGKALGRYHGGTVVAVYETQNNYARVAVVGEGRDYSVYDTQEQSGYAEGWMKADYLCWGNRADFIGTRNDLPIARVKGAEATVYDIQVKPLGVLSRDMRMLVLGELGNEGFCHVDTGDADPVLIRMQDVEILEDVHTPGDLPVLGYGVIRDSFGDMKEQGFVPMYEYCVESHRSFELWEGLSVAITSAGDDWVQLKHRGVAGYIPAEGVELFLLDACKGNARVSAGTYTVGMESFLPGFYVFNCDEGDEMQVVKPSGTVRTFGSESGNYTVYLQDGDVVTLNGGSMAPLEGSSMVLTAQQPVFRGSGRYLCGEQLRSCSYWDYEIQPLDPQQEAWYEITTLSYDAAGKGECTRVSLSEDQRQFDSVSPVQMINLYDGELLEFHNCILRINFGNG